MEPIVDHLIVEPGIRVPLEEFEFTFVRSAGPGGQNVNKVNTKAVLRWPIASSTSLAIGVKQRFSAKYGNRLTTGGDLVLTSQRFRVQSSNKLDCLEKLQQMLATVATPPVRRKKTRPSLGSKQRRLEQKRHRSDTKSQRRERPSD